MLDSRPDNTQDLIPDYMRDLGPHNMRDSMPDNTPESELVRESTLIRDPMLERRESVKHRGTVSTYLTKARQVEDRLTHLEAVQKLPRDEQVHGLAAPIRYGFATLKVILPPFNSSFKFASCSDSL